MKSVLFILLATALTYATSMSAGRIVAHRLRVKLDGFLTFVAGSAILSMLVFLVTAAGLAHRGYFLALAAGIAALAMATGQLRWPAPGLTGRLKRAILLEDFSLPRGFVVAFWAVYLTFGWMYLSLALSPEISPDGVAYHVGLIARYYREYHFSRITTNFFANLPAAVEMLFLFAFSIGKESATAMVEFLFLALTPFGILGWARRAGYPVAGVVGALLFYVSPVVGRDGTAAYVDVATAAIAFALFYTLSLWREHPSVRLLAVAGLIAGFGMAAKYTQAVGILYGAGIVTFYLWRRWMELAKSVAAFGLCASLMVAPWLTKNAIFAGNPVAPFFNRVFSNPYVYPSSEAEFLQRNRHLNGVALAEIPLEAAVRGNRLESLAGPVFLLAPVALLALRIPAGRAVLLAAAVYLAPYFGDISVRLLVPALLFIALAMALAVERFRWLAVLLLAAHAVASWPRAMNLYVHPYAWRIEGATWRAALRRIPEDRYIREGRPDSTMAEMLGAIVPDKALILTYSMQNMTYQPHELIVPYRSAFGVRQADLLDQAAFEYARPERRFVFQFPEQRLRRIRLSLVDAGRQLWAVSELRVFLGQDEIPRLPSWRLRAQPNPWDVQMAFDNNPMTLWNVRDDSALEAYIKIDFGQEQTLDRLTADLPVYLGQCRMSVQREATPGHWVPLSSSMTVKAAPYPTNFRRAVAEQLKSNGISWIVSHDDEPLARELLQHSREWGASQLVFSNGFRLWRLD